jgi:hypothetical protein
MIGARLTGAPRSIWFAKRIKEYSSASCAPDHRPAGFGQRGFSLCGSRASGCAKRAHASEAGINKLNAERSETIY